MNLSNLSGHLFALSAAALLSTSAVAADLKVPGQFSTIQGAVDAASPGDKIRLAKGLYSEDVVLENKLSISLKGGDGVFVRSVRIRSSTLISVKEIAFTGSVGAGFFASAQLAIEGSKEIDVRLCAFSGETFGVGAFDSKEVKVRDSECKSMPTGVFLESTTKATITGMKFIDCSQSGLGTDGADGMLFSDCVSIDSDAFILGADGATITDNVFKRSGLEIISGEGSLIERNRFKKSPKIALALEGASDNLVLDNNAKKPSGSGLVLKAGSDGNEVRGNKVKGAAIAGLALLGDGNAVEQNVMKKSGTVDLFDDGEGNLIGANKFDTSNL